MRESSVAAPIVADMLRYLERAGVPLQDAAREAGIAVPFPAGPEDRVPGGQVERLWRVAMERTGDPLVGLHMAEAYSPGALDILGYVILNCRTIGEVLHRLARYARIMNDGMRIEVVREGKVAWCCCSCVASLDNYLLRSPDQAIDTVWAGLTRELGRLTAKPLVPTAVWFRHRAPPKELVGEYQRVLKAPVTFGTREDRFIVPIGHLEEPVPSANATLLRTFDQYADNVLAGMGRQGTKSHQVARVLAGRLKGAVPPLSEIARKLAMSDRNLSLGAIYASSILPGVAETNLGVQIGGAVSRAIPGGAVTLDGSLNYQRIKPDAATLDQYSLTLGWRHGIAPQLILIGTSRVDVNHVWALRYRSTTLAGVGVHLVMRPTLSLVVAPGVGYVKSEQTDLGRLYSFANGQAPGVDGMAWGVHDMFTVQLTPMLSFSQGLLWLKGGRTKAQTHVEFAARLTGMVTRHVGLLIVFLRSYDSSIPAPVKNTISSLNSGIQLRP